MELEIKSFHFIYFYFCYNRKFLRSFDFCALENFQLIVKLKHANISLFDCLSLHYWQET